MSADMAVELKPHNVACVTLWPGTVRYISIFIKKIEFFRTEMAQIMQKNDEIGQVLKIDKVIFFKKRYWIKVF